MSMVLSLFVCAVPLYSEAQQKLSVDQLVDEAVRNNPEIIAPILEAWKKGKATDFPNYQAGTWGPEEADRLIAQDGRSWACPPLCNARTADVK